ncbi:MAG: hypothetical protein IBJ09_12715 [Bacteroidia bacterium]|nr:hypothetical protein [Bacteroidia bacterium]
MPNKTKYIRSFRESDNTQFSLVGGKGANLGELSRLSGIRVPDGFCITTEAFQRMIAETPALNQLLHELSGLHSQAREQITKLSTEIRRRIEETPISGDIREEIAQALSRFSAQEAFAIRSSATAEDLPNASFAGQQDSFLNIRGTEAIHMHIRKCQASLFTERAISYRIQNSFDHRRVQLAVIVQQMVFPQASGILFTADPVTGNRRVSSIDAGFGLGEALVSGRVNADTYKVREGRISDKKISVKKFAVRAAAPGGTKDQELPAGQQQQQTLTDIQILELERLGRRIEAYFGHPQDIEWCLADGLFYIVQSRPITTLFPVLEAPDTANRVYASVGHQQMMTDAMLPLGLSMWQMLAARPMQAAAGRLFIDVSEMLSTEKGRQMLLNTLGQSDPLTKDALQIVIDRNFIQIQSDETN